MRSRRVAFAGAVAAITAAACHLVVRTDDLIPGESSPALPDADDVPIGEPDAGDGVDAAAHVECLPEGDPCPSTEAPSMVRAGCFCIDATEVSRRHYARFVRAMMDAGNVEGKAVFPRPCQFKAGAFPAALVPATGLEEDDRPVTSVDWCDARAYCTWAGKRLCGAIAGGASSLGNPSSTKGQWFSACSGDGGRAYPYGAEYVPNRCNDGEESAPSGGDLAVVGGTVTCEGSIPGVFDLSGNAGEWEDACSGEDDRYDTCAARGGNAMFAHLPYQLGCDATIANRRDFRGTGLGFRCCSP